MSLPNTMRAVGFQSSLPIDAPDSLTEYQLPVPTVNSGELVVRVKAVSVNPADAKIRVRAASSEKLPQPRILGYDAVGQIVAIGEGVDGFALGDQVYYAGEVTRPGSNAEYQAVDARLVAHTPKSLTEAETAVLPLTALTAWEALFDRLKVDIHARKTILVIGGAGGVGSMFIQLAKQLTNLRVIATASRKESEAWVRQMGADYVVNHADLVNSVRDHDFDYVDYIFNCADTQGHWDAMAELIAPQGMICSIVEFDGGVDLSKLQGKSAGFIWELMFTRSLYQTQDISRQQDILFQLANLIDAGRIQSTLTETIQGFGADQFKQAHQMIESAATIGKIAILYDWFD
ncbi:zinc-binding alcohol dehydrogenase family protein [Vibrio sp.]|uniref:zinc-binding alcohol dehydrogenase family protein n=1 Tax=Vibrio sp. TaxID=678 RepID=UPI003D0F334E